MFLDIVPVSSTVPCDNPLVFQCAVPSLVVDADDDARAVSFWNSVEFEPSLKPSSSTARLIISKPSMQVVVLALCSDCRYGGPCSYRAAVSECQRQLVE